MAVPSRPRGNELARPEPFGELQRFNADLGQWLESLFDLPIATSDAFTPFADVEEADDTYLVEIELPGVDKKDVDIAIDGRRLTVTGERKERERTGILRRRTRSVGRFHYEVVLPGDIGEDGITASLDDGVLTVRVPKANVSRPRHIDVK
jgi:HSP20 family protein